MNVHDIFTPNEYPDHTYIERERGKYETDLEFQLKKNPAIVSLSGPSKSGKSMLLNNVIDRLDYDIITIHGSNIDSLWSLWENTLDQVDAPQNTQITESQQQETVKRGEAGVDIPFARAGVEGSQRNQESTQETINKARRGLNQVAELVDLDTFVLYIDDAHYIDEVKHERISEGIKNAYQRGMTICVAFIPYRSDDLTRANPDLSGRIDSISLDYWNEEDLEKIGKKGFKVLKRYPSELVLNNLARESVGSPHLMQSLCLEMCNELDIHQSGKKMKPLNAKPSNVKNVLRKTAENFYQDYSTIFELLSGEISKGGNDRKKYEYRPRGDGDVYNVLLRALGLNPPKLTFGRDEIIERVQKVCRNNTPQSGNLVQTLKRMDKWVTQNAPQNDFCFEWVDDRKRLEIPDPYLIFCLRWSDITETEPNLH